MKDIDLEGGKLIDLKLDLKIVPKSIENEGITGSFHHLECLEWFIIAIEWHSPNILILIDNLWPIHLEESSL